METKSTNGSSPQPELKQVEYNIALARLLRTAALMVEKGELIAGSFVGISSAGVVTGGTSDLGDHPGNYLLLGALYVEHAKLASKIGSFQRPTTLSPIITPRA